MNQDLNILSNNASIPFYPSITWEYVNSDIILEGTAPGHYIASGLTFSWIQAFFDQDNITDPAKLAIWSGRIAADGVTPVLSLVRFAYSGERINIKGNALFTSGVNIKGQLVSSSPIGSVATTDLQQVIAYGGMY